MRIVHLGLGNFFRAHQAWYTDRANRESSQHWSITGVCMRRPLLRDMLVQQDCAYTLEISDVGGRQMHKIEVLDSVLVAAEEPQKVISAIADENTAIVTLTVTEKGYDLKADGRLNRESANIRSDLEQGTHRSMVGLLATALEARSSRNAPLTIMSCDNLPRNSRQLRQAVLEYSELAGMGIADYLDRFVSFPCTMVDRITPATDAALEARVAETTLPPRAPVSAEMFTDWIIEDDFSGPRPKWELAGVSFVDDVAPFELRKLRMLNGPHSYVAYAGILAGYAYVHEAIADPVIRRVTELIMDEAMATLPPRSRNDGAAHKASLLRRFENPFLHHGLRQITNDGSVKLPLRVLPVIEARAAMGLPSPGCEALLAAWRRFLEAEIECGRDLHDPSATELRLFIQQGADAASILEALK